MKILVITLLLNFLLVACVLDCADKKTGMPRVSQTIEQSKKNSVFIRQFYPDRLLLIIDSGRVFTIREAWIENNWKYECIDGRPQIVKDTTMQLVIDGSVPAGMEITDHWLGSDALGYAGIGAQLSYPYNGQDSIHLFRRHKKQIIDTLTLLSR